MRARVPPHARLVLLAVVVAATFAVVALSGSLSADRIRDAIDGFGVVGPVAFVAVGGVLNCVFFPGPLLAAAAGLLFGTALGTPVAICSALASAVLACATSRWVAGDAIESIGGPRVRALAARMERRGFLAVLYLRLVPGMPYTLVNYAVGLTRIPLPVFAAATLLGTAPRTFAYVALGGSFGDFGRPETIAAVAILVLMGAGGLAAGRLRPSAPGRGSSSPAGRSAGRP